MWYPRFTLLRLTKSNFTQKMLQTNPLNSKIGHLPSLRQTSNRSLHKIEVYSNILFNTIVSRRRTRVVESNKRATSRTSEYPSAFELLKQRIDNSFQSTLYYRNICNSFEFLGIFHGRSIVEGNCMEVLISIALVQASNLPISHRGPR